MKNFITESIQFARTIVRAKREGRTDELLRSLKEQDQLRIKKRIEIQKIQKTMMQPKRYETINGAGEIGWGMFVLCMALASYSSVVLPNSMQKWRGGMGFLFLFCGCLAMPLCRWAIKKFVTEPRVGYVAFRREKTFWITIVTSVVVAVGISIGLTHLMRPEMIKLAQSQAHNTSATAPVTFSHTDKIMLAVFIVSNTIMYLMMNAFSIKEHRWKWLLLVLITLVPLGIYLFIPGNFYALFRPIGLFLGLVWLASGVVTLFSFIRPYQPPAPDAE
jgi:hypothetical protein